MRLLSLLSLASLYACLLGCEEPNRLNGSITDSHDLSFDSVRLRLLTDQQVYELRYEKALDGGATDIVAKVVFDAPAGGVTIDDAIDLVATDGRVERITAKNDPFPGMERGDFTFAVGGTAEGEATSGSWGATFDNGKTIEGAFDTALEHVAFE